MSIQNNKLPDNPQIEVIKTGKTGLFTNYIYKAIPLAFDESMSYYETLCGLLNYLKNVVIPTVNNNADAVAELQSLYEQLRIYVDNYFTNLDVQEEINNKLDQMVADGTLPEIVASYLNSKAIFGFDNVESMKNSTNLINGSYAETLGYRTKGDGGKALYKIRTITNDDVVDEMTIIKIGDSNNELVAELIFDSMINLKQLGAYGDNSHDDSTPFKKSIDLAKTNKMEIYIPTGTYKLEPNVFQGISNTSSYNNLTFKGDGKYQSNLKLNNTTTGQWLFDSRIRQIYNRINFYELGFIGNDTTANGFYCYSTGNEKQLRFYNCYFELNNTLYCDGTGNADLHRFYNCNMDSYGDFITLDNDQSVDTELYGCGGVVYGSLIKQKRGGNCNIFGGAFDCYTYNNNIKYTFDMSEGSMGIGNMGIFCTGTRFEFHQGHKFINATSNLKTLLSFKDCNFGTVEQITESYAIIYQNATVLFDNCSINKFLTFYVYTTGTFLSNSSLGALLKFNNCSTTTQFWKLITTEGNFSRVIADNCMNISVYGTNESNDFDLNANQRSISAVTTKTKICYIKKNGEGFPVSGNGINFNLPPNAYIKRIKIYRPTIAGSNNPYQLHIGSRDETIVYAETSESSIFSNEINIDVSDVGVVADGQIRMWATGSATNVTAQGYAYIEYI